MSTSLSGLPDDDITAALAQDRLGVPAVVFFVMSAAAPLTVVAGLAVSAYAMTGLTGIPSAFIAVGIALTVFSVGYVAMSRYLPHAGAFYAYVSHGLGKSLGVGAAWVALAAYNCLQIALYGGFGMAGKDLIKQYAGVELPWWVVALLAWALVAVLGLLRVDLNGTVLAVLLVAEILVTLVYDFAFVSHPAHGLELGPLSPANMFTPSAGALMAIAVLGFVGFESAVVFSEESRNPRRTVPLATFTSVIIIAVLYGLSSWAVAVSTGVDKINERAASEQIGLVFGLAGQHLGPFFADLGSILFLTSLLAAMISFHNTIARYIFALGRERVLPAVFGGTNASGVPTAGSISQTVTAVVVLAIYVVLNLDPYAYLFFALGTSGGFGALILIAWTSVAVLAYFRRNQHNESVLRGTVMPAISVVLMSGMLILAVWHFALVLGVPESHPLRWGVPFAYLVVAALGSAYGVWLRSARSNVYHSIGMGAKSTHGSMLTGAFPAEGPASAFGAGQ